MRQDTPFVFKKKSHQEQAKVNDRIEESITEAETQLAEVAADAYEGSQLASKVESIQQSLKRGKKIVAERQKLLKIADRSEFGWAVVAEYTADELAEDSDDEKRINKAEKAAEKKAARKKKGPASRFRSAVYKRPYQPYQQPTPTTSPVAPSTPLSVRRPPPMIPTGTPRQLQGPCFACGQLGHIRAYCPKAQGPSSSKTLYPPICAIRGTMVKNCVGTLSSVQIGESKFDHLASSEVVCTHVVDPGVCFSEEVNSAVLDSSGQDKEGLVTRDDVHGESQAADLYTDGCTAGGDVDIWADSMVNMFAPLVTSEIGMEKSGSPVCVKGRLKQNVEFWKNELKAPPTVISTIEAGYVLPLLSEPPQSFQKNQFSARAKFDFVQDSIDELLASQCIRRVEQTPHICSPLSVVESSSGKLRLVVNLRFLNRYLWKQKFKYEDLRTAMFFFEQGDIMFSFDLKSGYHHVDIAEIHQKYLGFEWGGVFYVFTVLPFGLSTACYIFTKLLRPLVRYWRAKGIRITVYLDDGLAVVQNRQKAEEFSAIVRSTLDRAGFLWHPAKSHWTPVERLTWLGFVIDLSAGQLEVPKEKILALKQQIHKALELTKIPARLLASIVGKIISMGLAIGPIARFMTRNLYALLETRYAWCEHLHLNVEAIKELEFWKSSITKYNAQPFWRVPAAVRIVYSDASDTGFGGYVVEHGPCEAHGQWSPDEVVQSSTWRELTAVLRVLHSMTIKLRNSQVRWFTDNQNVAHILRVGSRQQHLQKIAMEVFSLAIQNHILIEPEWIPRELNKKADCLSRIIDYDDWMLNPVVFEQLDSLWGPHTIDRFATNSNAQLPRFNSRYWCPGTEAIDTFTTQWASENNWLCPPVALIPRAIRHAELCAATCTLVVPSWTSAPFWPLLCPEGNQFAGFVTSVCELPRIQHLFLPTSSGAALFSGEIPNTPVYGLRCKF